MNANAEKWVQALESGRFKQGAGRLHRKVNGEDRFCCLGVACRVAIENGVEVAVSPGGPAGCVAYVGETTHMPTPVREWIGLADEGGAYGNDRYLVNDNDDGASFAEIAQTIRTHPELFEDAS